MHHGDLRIKELLVQSLLPLSPFCVCVSKVSCLHTLSKGSARFLVRFAIQFLAASFQ